MITVDLEKHISFPDPLDINPISTTAITEHVKAPYSGKSLAISPKSFITLDRQLIKTNEHVSEGLIKREGSLVLNLHYDDSPDIIDAHIAVSNEAVRILGRSGLEATEIFLTHDRSVIGAGQAQRIDTPHIDGWPRREEEYLILVAILSNRLPPKVIHNKIKASDLNRAGHLVSIDGIPIDQVDVVVEDLPINKPGILSPSTPHFGQIALKSIANRRFMRWQFIMRDRAFWWR